MGGADGRVQGCVSWINVSVGGSGPPPSPWFHILLGLHSPAFSEGAHCPGGGLEGKARPSFSMQMPSAMQVIVAQSVSRTLGPPSWTTSCLVGLRCSEGGGLRNLTNHFYMTWACLLSRQSGWPVFLASKGRPCGWTCGRGGVGEQGQVRVPGAGAREGAAGGGCGLGAAQGPGAQGRATGRACYYCKWVGSFLFPQRVCLASASPDKGLGSWSAVSPLDHKGLGEVPGGRLWLWGQDWRRGKTPP